LPTVAAETANGFAANQTRIAATMNLAGLVVMHHSVPRLLKGWWNMKIPNMVDYFQININNIDIFAQNDHFCKTNK
jgi:hypothetical protein